MARSAVSDGGDFEAMVRQLQRRVEILERRPMPAVAPLTAEDDPESYYCRVYDSDGQTILDVTNTGIAFDVDVSDNFAMHQPNSGNIDIKVTGWYSCSYRGVVIAGSSGFMAHWIDVDGIAGERWATSQVAFNAGSPQFVTGCEDIFLRAGQYVMLGCYQNSGGPIAMSGGSGLQVVLRKKTEIQ